MSLLNILDPVFEFLSGIFSLLLPASLVLVLWGLVFSVVTYLIYECLAVKSDGDTFKKKILLHFDTLLSKDHGFFELLHDLWLANLLILKQLSRVLFPTLVSALPFVMLLIWLDGSYRYESPKPGELLTYHLHFKNSDQSVERSLEVAEGEFAMRDNDGNLLTGFPTVKAIPVIHQKKWWNVLIGNPIGYLPAESNVDWVEFEYKRFEVAGIGPGWMRGWEIWLFVPFIFSALALRFMFKKKNESDVIEEVSGDQLLMSALVAGNQQLFVALGNLETWFLWKRLDRIPIEKPVYVTGIARAGTTILLEILSKHKKVATHRYADFPFVHVPYFWNKMISIFSRSNQGAKERAHKDRIKITPQSPEAIEEVLWMTFFSKLHHVRLSSIKNEDTMNAPFEKFYDEHLRKILLLRKKERYVAKGNYNITRLEYLQQMYRDAKFLVVVRNPVDHIASLIKQHKLYCKMESESESALRFMQRVGHFEFGLDVRPIHVEEPETLKRIIDCWNDPEESVRGWAIYWNMVYGWFNRRLEENPKLADAVYTVVYEKFCEQTEIELRNIFEHLELDVDKGLIEEYSEKIEPPKYYQVGFSEKELLMIAEEAGETAEVFGYDKEITTKVTENTESV